MAVAFPLFDSAEQLTRRFTKPRPAEMLFERAAGPCPGTETVRQGARRSPGPVERGFARLKNRRVLGKVRTFPNWATALVRTLLFLTNRDVTR